MVFMNFTVSFVGIFMAAKLDDIFRVWPHRDERIILTGHWHILTAIIATIILLYYADLAGMKGRARKIFGWSVIIFSNSHLAAATILHEASLCEQISPTTTGQLDHAAESIWPGFGSGSTGNVDDLAPG